MLGARGAGASELLGVADRVDLRIGTFSKSLASCGGFVAGTHEVIEYLRFYSRAFLFTASAVPAAVGAALAALRVLRSEEGPALFSSVLENAWRLHDGLLELGFAVSHPQALGADERLQVHAPGVRPAASGSGHEIVTPIISVLVGDDWKAALLWRALYRRRRVRQHRSAPRGAPGGALLRTSVMATHDEATLDRALEVFARVKREFEAEHGPLPGPDAR